MEHGSQVKSTSLSDTKILKTAIVDSFRKLHPRTMIKNPVMFVVEVGALLTSIQLVARYPSSCRAVWLRLADYPVALVHCAFCKFR